MVNHASGALTTNVRGLRNTIQLQFLTKVWTDHITQLYLPAVLTIPLSLPTKKWMALATVNRTGCHLRILWLPLPYKTSLSSVVCLCGGSDSTMYQSQECKEACALQSLCPYVDSFLLVEVFFNNNLFGVQIHPSLVNLVSFVLPPVTTISVYLFCFHRHGNSRCHYKKALARILLVGVCDDVPWGLCFLLVWEPCVSSWLLLLQSYKDFLVCWRWVGLSVHSSGFCFAKFGGEGGPYVGQATKVPSALCGMCI